MAETDDLRARRAAYDRRARAWTFTVLGAIGAWLSFALIVQGGVLEVVGWGAFVVGLSAAVYGLTLFTPQRP